MQKLIIKQLICGHLADSIGETAIKRRGNVFTQHFSRSLEQIKICKLSALGDLYTESLTKSDTGFEAVFALFFTNKYTLGKKVSLKNAFHYDRFLSVIFGNF